jgi:hypothetical protein
MRKLARKLAYKLMKFGTYGHWQVEIKANCSECDSQIHQAINLFTLFDIK